MHYLCGFSTREVSWVKTEFRGGTKLWLRRPLSDEFLRYAARDVYAINLLFDHFTGKNYIDHHRLIDQSRRYITMWDERPNPSNGMKNHSLLPLGILDWSFAFCKECKSCHRSLPSECYSNTGWKLAEKRQCWVCRALSVKENLQTQWNRDDDDYF
jgi:exonuclease 3'-5' domain-containing protein 1